VSLCVFRALLSALVASDCNDAALHHIDDRVKCWTHTAGVLRGGDCSHRSLVLSWTPSRWLCCIDVALSFFKVHVRGLWAVMLTV
jgi:hypothetical protein